MLCKVAVAALTVTYLAACGRIAAIGDAGSDGSRDSMHDTERPIGDATGGDATAGDATGGDATGGDARGGDATGGDAMTDRPPARCNPSAPFQPATPVTSINTSVSEEAAYLSPDERTLFFSSTRAGALAGSYDLFVATRSARDAAFTTVVPVVGVNTSASERHPVVTGDGLTLYAITGGAPNWQISVSRRNTDADAFAPLAVVTALDSSTNDEMTHVLPDHRALYFHSDRSGNYDIYRAPLSNGQFGTPLPVSGVSLNTAATEHSAITTPDELTLLFASDRAGGVGAADIYFARRASTADGFGAPMNLQSLNTSGNDSPSWVSSDGCVVYLTRGAVGAYEIFVATRGP